MGSLKWEVVRGQLEETDDKLAFVKDKFVKYDKDSRYAPAYRYIGVQLMKYALDRTKKQTTFGKDVVDMVDVLLEVVALLEEEEEVVIYLNRLAPHLVHALANLTGSVAGARCLCHVTSTLHPILAQFGRQPTNGTVVNVLLKLVSRLKQEQEAVLGCALSYVPLVSDPKPFSSLPANLLLLIRDMDSGVLIRDCLYKLWSTIEWCLAEQLTTRLPDLLFYIIQICVENAEFEPEPALRLLQLYMDSLSLQTLYKLFETALQMTTSPLDRMEPPPPDLLDLFGMSDKDVIWILLALSQYYSFWILRTPAVAATWSPLIFQLSKIMHRSPQDAVKDRGSRLLAHTLRSVTGLESYLGGIDGYENYSQLLILTIQNIDKTGLPGDEVSEHLGAVSRHLQDNNQKVELMELVTRIPDYVISEEICVQLATSYRTLGHLSDAVSAIGTLKDPSPSTSLLQVYCLLSKLECEPAISILNKINSKDKVVVSSVKILLTYCHFVTTLRNKEQFSLDNPQQFCKEATTILTSDTPVDDTLLSILMFLGGLHGLTRAVSRGAALLSPTPSNLISALSAVPALTANQMALTWSRDLEVLTSGETEELECMWSELQTDTQPDTERDLKCGVCGGVLLDRRLRDGYTVYDVSEEWVRYTLQAAHTKLKSWKRTSMSTRALLWQNCGMVPYTLQTLASYITLLYTWGSVHQTLSHLDRLEQLSKLTRSEFWLSRHRNLSAVIRVTLQNTAKVPSPVTAPDFRPGDELLGELLENERFRAAETSIVIAAAERGNGVLQRDDVTPGQGDVTYPVFSSCLSAEHSARLTVLQLSLSWSIAPPNQDSMVEYHHSLKKSLESWAHRQTSTPGYLGRVSRAWACLLEDSQPKVSIVEEQENRPGPRRGRSRAARTTRTTAKRATLRKGPSRAKAVAKRDVVEEGLEACSGLEPVFVKRELLKRKIKRAPKWSDVEEYHNQPFKHQLRYVARKYVSQGDQVVSRDDDDVTFPESWTVASIMKIGGCLYIGKKTSSSEVVFKRELPFTLKSLGVGSENMSCIDEMRQIILSNDNSVTHSTDKVKFWKSRYELNSRLEGLVEKLEEEWLGPWKGLLFGRPAQAEYWERIQRDGRQLRKSLKANHKVDIDVFLSEYLLDCYSILTEDTISELLPTITPISQVLNIIHELAPPAPPSRHPTLLLLGPHLEGLPWESCKSYKNQAVSRIPSVNFALTLQKSRSVPIQLQKEDTFYILNPAQNLPSTQECFEGWLSEQEGWRGVAAKPPSLPEYQAGLQSDMFLYLGHGSGKEFLAGNPIQELDSRAVALLMGCSTGRIKNTPLGATGTPVEYLLSGCPAVLGYLWNITDKDCDRFSKKLLESWLSQGGSVSLLSLINPSREACKLPFLVGAAPVLYGVPDILQKQVK